MRMDDFTRLPNQKKAFLLYKRGVYIGKCKYGNTIAVLYQLEGFYAEVIYRIYRREINHIRCFSGTKGLDPYLAGIDVEYLVM